MEGFLSLSFSRIACGMHLQYNGCLRSFINITTIYMYRYYILPPCVCMCVYCVCSVNFFTFCFIILFFFSRMHAYIHEEWLLYVSGVRQGREIYSFVIYMHFARWVQGFHCIITVALQIAMTLSLWLSSLF